MDRARSCTDEFHNLFEILIGMNFPVKDMLNIQHELDPHYPHASHSPPGHTWFLDKQFLFVICVIACVCMVLRLLMICDT